MLAATIDFIDDQADSGDRRSGTNRVPIGRPSTLRTPERAPIDIAVEDLSAHGFRFTLNKALPIGAIVRVGLDGAGVQDGRIVRRDDNTYGCAFLEPLSPHRLITSFNAASVVQGQFVTGGAARMTEEFGQWPGLVRLAILLGASGALWVALLTGAYLLFS